MGFSAINKYELNILTVEEDNSFTTTRDFVLVSIIDMAVDGPRVLTDRDAKVKDIAAQKLQAVNIDMYDLGVSKLLLPRGKHYVDGDAIVSLDLVITEGTGYMQYEENPDVILTRTIDIVAVDLNDSSEVKRMSVDLRGFDSGTDFANLMKTKIDENFAAYVDHVTAGSGNFRVYDIPSHMLMFDRYYEYKPDGTNKYALIMEKI